VNVPRRRFARCRQVVLRVASAVAVAAALSQFPWSRAGVMPPLARATVAAPDAAPRAEVADLAALLPAEPLLVVEARDLGTLLSTLPTGELRQRLFATPSWKQFRKSPEHAQLLAGATFLELTAGMPIGELLGTLFGQQLVAAVVPASGDGAQPELLLAVRAADADRVAQVLTVARAAVTAKRDAADGSRIENVGSDEAVVLQGKLWVGAVGRDLFAASSAGRFAQLMLRARGGAAKTVAPLLADARADASAGALLTAAIDLRRIAAALPGGLQLPEGKLDAGRALLVGDLIGAVRRADVARFELGRGERSLRLSLALPHDPAEPLPAHYRCFAHADAGQQPLPLLLPREALLVLTMRRDWAAFWADHGELCDPSAEPAFVEAKTNFGVLFGGRSLPDELLPALDQPFLFVLTRQEWEGVTPPSIRYPAGALIWRTRPGQAAIVADFESAVLGAIALGNFGAAEEQKRTTPYRLALEEHRGTRIVAGVVAADQFAAADLMHQNLEPCFAQVGDWLIAASSRRLLRELIDELGARAAAPQTALHAPVGTLTSVELFAAAGARLAEEDRAALVQNAVLNEGKEPARAEFETGVLIDLLRELDCAKLSTRVDGAAFHVELEVALAARAEPAPRAAGAGQ